MTEWKLKKVKWLKSFIVLGGQKGRKTSAFVNVWSWYQEKLSSNIVCNSFRVGVRMCENFFAPYPNFWQN